MKDSQPIPLKLRTAAALDYPTASEILVSFPEEWELVQTLHREMVGRESRLVYS
jgi:hypothetical protein